MIIHTNPYNIYKSYFSLETLKNDRYDVILYSGVDIRKYTDNKFFLFLVPMYDKDDPYWKINKKPLPNQNWHMIDSHDSSRWKYAPKIQPKKDKDNE